MSAFQSYYHLRKESFSIDPWADSEIYFGAGHLQDRITRRINSDFVQQRAVPKFFLFGRYGAGKTHTLAHIAHVLRTDPELARDFPTEPIYFELAPLRTREKWSTVHERLINSIGLPRLKEAVSALVSNAGPQTDPLQALQDEEVLRFGETALQNSQAQIFRNLLFGGRQETLSWEWLKGRQLKIDEAQMLSTETSLTEPSDFIACLLNCASLYAKGLGRKIVLLVDEGEALGDVENADALHEFEFAIRRLVGNENNVLGLILAYQTEGGAAPRVLQHDGIRRRVDYDQGFIDLTGLVLAPEDARQFILEVINYLVDGDAAKATIDAEGLTESEPEFFPFTPDSVDAIADYVTQEPDRSLPSQIIALLSNAVIEGWGRRSTSPNGHVLIEDEIANLVMYPDES
jgi:hypothetical protein